MELKLRLHIKPLSINSTYYANKSFGKTKDAQAWTDDTLYQLRKYEKQMAEMVAIFDPRVHVYTAHLTMNVPIDIYYTNKGVLSSKVIDLTNYEKSLIDVIMLKKFYGTNYPKQCLNLNTDDRYLQRMVSEKVPSDSWYIDVIMRITKKPTLVGSKDF